MYNRGYVQPGQRVVVAPGQPQMVDQYGRPIRMQQQQPVCFLPLMPPEAPT